MTAVIEKVYDISLEPDGRTLKYILADDDGNSVEGEFDLDVYLENCNGQFSWGGRSFSKTARETSLDPDTFQLSASLQYRDQTWSEKETTVINLAERIFNVKGHLTYLEFGDDPLPGPSGGLDLEGDIDGRTFAVASDGPNDICRIAYRTILNNKISFAEVKYDGERKSWSLPKEIDLYKKHATPGQNIAFTVDPIDPNKRHLFFCQETGSGEIYQQTFNPEDQKWDEPKRLDDYKAHRFSKFAASYYNVDNVKLLLFYYVNESNDLQEIVGVPEENEDAPGEYVYNWTSFSLSPKTKGVPPNTFLAVSQREKDTVLIYRAPKTTDVSLVRALERDPDEGYRAKWTTPQVLVKEADLLRHSPLAIAHRYHGQLLTYFYVKRNGREKIIYSQDYLPDKNFPVRNVGKLESESILGAASFSQNPVYDARLFSVSNLDGDDILVERVPKFVGTQRSWVIAGGVIDTDVDQLSTEARSTTVA